MENALVEKKILHEKIDSLPDELTIGVMHYVDFLESNYEDLGAPESVEIHDRESLKEKLQEGINDIEAGRTCPWSEVYTDLRKIYGSKWSA